MPLELDFLNEGRNAEKLADMLKQFDFLKVCGRHVAVREDVIGLKDKILQYCICCGESTVQHIVLFSRFYQILKVTVKD